MGRNKLITVIGNIASGKSTLTDLLVKNLPAIKIDSDSFYKSNRLFPLALKDRRRWSFASDMWFLSDRINAMAKLKSYLLKQNVVIDSGLPMSWVFANSRLRDKYYTKEEWNLYQRIYGQLTVYLIPSDIIIYQYAATRFLLNQIKKRHRSFELKYYDKRYLKNIELSIKEYIKTISKQTKIITIDRRRNDFVNNKQVLTELISEL